MHTLKKEQHFSVIKRNYTSSTQDSYQHQNYLNTERIPHDFGDRFIPRRYLLENNKINIKLSEEETETDVLSNGPFKMQKDGYISTLKTLFGGQERRILALSDPNIRSPNFKTFINQHQDWPCRPRKRQQAYKIGTYALIETSHRHINKNMFDWSVHNEMAAAMGNNLFTWSVEANEPKHYSHNNWNLNCMAYSPCGNYLAMGGKTIEYCKRGVNTYTSICCYSMTDELAEIISLAWSKNGDRIVAGSSVGKIYVFDVEELEVLRKLEVHNAPVENIQFSPNMRYMASGDSKGTIVIHCWNSCIVYLCIKTRNMLNKNIKGFFAFHPWNDTELAIAESSPASLKIMHLPTRKYVAHYGRWDRNVTIDAISFNKITAELLVSFISKDTNEMLEQKIHVFSSLTQVVEVLQIPLYGVRFLMWSPNGTSLVTLGLQPAITIWNFCPDHEHKATNEKKNKKQKKPFLSPEMFKWTNIR